MISFDLENRMPACFIFGAGEFYGLQNQPREGDLVIAADGGFAHLKALSIKPDIVIGDFDSEPEALLLSGAAGAHEKAFSGAGFGEEQTYKAGSGDVHAAGLAEADSLQRVTQERECRQKKYAEQQGVYTPLQGGSLGAIYEKTDAKAWNQADILKLPVIKDLSDSAAALKLGKERGYRLFYLYGCTGGRLDHTLASIQDIAACSMEGIQCYLFDKAAAVTALTANSLLFPAHMRGMISVFAHTDCCEEVREQGLKYEVAEESLRNSFPLGLSNEFTGRDASVSVGAGTLVLYFELPKKGKTG